MTEIVLALAVGGAFVITALAFLPSKQLDPRPVRARNNDVRRHRR